jgi:hypothetical protein
MIRDGDIGVETDGYGALLQGSYFCPKIISTSWEESFRPFICLRLLDDGVLFLVVCMRAATVGAEPRGPGADGVEVGLLEADCMRRCASTRPLSSGPHCISHSWWVKVA